MKIRNRKTGLQMDVEIKGYTLDDDGMNDIEGILSVDSLKQLISEWEDAEEANFWTRTSIANQAKRIEKIDRRLRMIENLLDQTEEERLRRNNETQE